MAGISRTQSYSSDSGGGSPTGSPGPSSSSRRGSKTYMCKICGHEFASGQSLGGHMNVHRRDQRSPRSESAQTGDGGHHDYKGVRYRKEQNKWVAEIRPPKANRTWWLGTYSSAREAAYAYDVAITYFRSETALNFRGHPVYDQIPEIDRDLPNQEFAARLREVVKKYGKMAMESGAGPSSSSDQAELSWDDFPESLPPLEQNDFNSFNVEDMMPQPDPSEYQGQVHDSYYGYQPPYGWPPYNPRDY